MECFFHIDRANSLEEGQVLDLGHSEAILPAIEERYPDGLSRFGREYSQRDLVELENQWGVVEGEFQGLNMNAVYDSFFELVRLSEFSGKPSRFQSIFCWVTLETVRDFIRDYSEYPVTVWEIETEKGQKADWELLRAESFGHGLQNAQRYWTGDGTDNPTWEIVIPLPVEVGSKVAEVNGPDDIPALED